MILAIERGGIDNGASYGFVDEDETNLSIGYMLDYELRLSGITTYMTREKDEYISLQQRALTANIKQADIFVSIHCDAFHNETSKGMSVHISENNSKKALLLAEFINNNLIIQFPDHQHRGIKKSNFYVLNKTTMPAVLIECEFLSNPETRGFLKKPENQRRLARTICTSIIYYFKSVETL